MNIIKSIFVLLGLLLLLLLTILITVKIIKRFSVRPCVLHEKILFASLWVVVICTIVLFIDFTNPLDRTLTPTLVAEFSVPEQYWLEYPGQKFWHGAYEAFGLYAESFYFNPYEKRSIYGFDWPPMDFKRYCYIITYGQKIESLSYNVWETIDAPIVTGAKAGKMVLCADFSPDKIYVYQIPKIRIENDVNKTIRH